MLLEKTGERPDDLKNKYKKGKKENKKERKDLKVTKLIKKGRSKK
jgi:hypothetical protein